MKLEFVPLWDVDEHWAELSPMLARALERQTAMTPESLYQDVKRGKYCLWRIPARAAFVTEIQNFPAERICMIVLCGGDGVNEWHEVADATLTRHARALGCTALVIVGRQGWSRLRPEYKVEDVVMRKSL